MTKPKIFIASSSEKLVVAKTLQVLLDHDAEVTVWPQGVVRPTQYTAAALISRAPDFDFAIFVFAADDKMVVRDEEFNSVRDNVLFEFGLFVGVIGLSRCFLVSPRGGKDVRVPTDLTGLTPINYNANRDDQDLTSALGSVATIIEQELRTQGLRSRIPLAANGVTDSSTLGLDDNDHYTILEAWLLNRPNADSGKAARYDSIDAELEMPVGTTRRLLSKVAADHRYDVGGGGTVFSLKKRPLPPPRRLEW